MFKKCRSGIRTLDFGEVKSKQLTLAIRCLLEIKSRINILKALKTLTRSSFYFILDSSLFTEVKNTSAFVHQNQEF